MTIHISNSVKAEIKKHTALYYVLRQARDKYKLLQHSVAGRVPSIVKPRNRKVFIAITSFCNARCLGCRYGRDFMPNEQLSLATVRGVLEDAAAAGFSDIRFYGGEPLLHPDLPKMIAYAKRLNLSPYLTTNATLLTERLAVLFDAGLRDITIGRYGTGDDYDRYVQKPGLYKQFENALESVRKQYGSRISLQLNWLLMNPSCTVQNFRKVRELASRYDATLQIDLIHYSLPYFTEGPDNELRLRGKDKERIEFLVRELLETKEKYPHLIGQSRQTLLSIPDWLLKREKMRVPCTAYEMIWIGANGTVQNCYVTFPLGNLKNQRLKDMLGTVEHHRAAKDIFSLNCPNCHCGYGERIMRHRFSKNKYTG